eukprot:3134050-Rhodomonas_salina.1
MSGESAPPAREMEYMIPSLYTLRNANLALTPGMDSACCSQAIQHMPVHKENPSVQVGGSGVSNRWCACLTA